MINWLNLFYVTYLGVIHGLAHYAVNNCEVEILLCASFIISTPGIRNYKWEYRWMDYPHRARDVSHRCDQSVLTLIRCYFSTEYKQAHRIAAYGEV
nr:hypothetical protein [Tanacetum cinerariifolium]